MDTTANSVLIESSSNFQITRTGVKSNSSQIRLLTSVLLALERRERSFGHGNTFIFDRILVRFAGNENMNEISDEFDFQPYRTLSFGVTRP